MHSTACQLVIWFEYETKRLQLGLSSRFNDVGIKCRRLTELFILGICLLVLTEYEVFQASCQLFLSDKERELLVVFE